jgi:hypothetical protein
VTTSRESTETIFGKVKATLTVERLDTLYAAYGATINIYGGCLQGKNVSISTWIEPIYGLCVAAEENVFINNQYSFTHQFKDNNASFNDQNYLNKVPKLTVHGSAPNWHLSGFANDLNRVEGNKLILDNLYDNSNLYKSESFKDEVEQYQPNV